MKCPQGGSGNVRQTSSPGKHKRKRKILILVYGLYSKEITRIIEKDAPVNLVAIAMPEYDICHLTEKLLNPYDIVFLPLLDIKIDIQSLPNNINDSVANFVRRLLRSDIFDRYQEIIKLIKEKNPNTWIILYDEGELYRVKGYNNFVSKMRNKENIRYIKTIFSQQIPAMIMSIMFGMFQISYDEKQK